MKKCRAPSKQKSPLHTKARMNARHRMLAQ